MTKMNIKDNFKDLFDFAYELTTYEFIYKRAPGLIDLLIGIFHLNRIRHLLLGIIELCSNGLLIESQILLRSLLNIRIYLKWMNAEDSDKRKQRYRDFEIVFCKKAAESTYKFYGKLIDTSTADYRQSEQLFNNVITKYNIKDYKKLKSWSPKSIRQMAEDVNLEREYEITYSRLSEYEHCGPSSIVDYYGIEDITFEANLNNLPSIFIGGCEYFICALEDIFKMMNGLFTDITFARLKLNKLAQKYLIKDLRVTSTSF
jgi:hypothetical protein